MQSLLKLKAKLRKNLGKKNNRIIRNTQNAVPSIIYGDYKPVQTITLNHKIILDLSKNQKFYSSIISILIESEKIEEKVILKCLQHHPYKNKILHLDFIRIKKNKIISTYIPIVIINKEESIGIKNGGIVSHITKKIKIKCLPQNIPQCINVDISTLKLNKILYLYNITLPKNVTLTTWNKKNDKKIAIVIIKIPKVKSITENDDIENNENKKEQST